MEWVNREDIKAYGSYEDRLDSFDDEEDVKIFIHFLKKVYSTEYTFKSKPFGKYGVDLGVYKNDKFVLAIDIERWSKWGEEWPTNYKYVSFLSRKLKFVYKHKKFVMVFFNFDRTKFICVNKEEIMKYPSGRRYTQGKMDSVIKIPFNDTRMYGSNLTDKEKLLFKNHKILDVK
jgi:hypothetical protein